MSIKWGIKIPYKQATCTHLTRGTQFNILTGRPCDPAGPCGPVSPLCPWGPSGPRGPVGPASP